MPFAGIRPIDLNRDLGQVAQLVELCFGAVLDQAGRSAVREMQFLDRHRPLMRLLSGMADRLPSWGLGFVWDEAGQVVGNVSLQRAATPGHWLVANVAVHPAHRRRGIGRHLTHAALEFIRRQGGRYAALQVDDDNAAAVELYRGLGFVHVTTRSLWQRMPGPLAQSPATNLQITPRAASEWRTQLALAQRTLPEGLTWDQPLSPHDFRPSWARSLSRFFAGQVEEHWLTRGPGGGDAVGSISLLTNEGDHDRLVLLVGTNSQGRVERALVSRALRRLAQRRWPVRLEYPSDVPDAVAALSELGFRQARRLMWMRLDLARAA